MTHTILIAEDELLQRRMLMSVLERKLGYGVIAVANGHEALVRVRESNVGDISAVLLDLNMPEMDGFAALKSIRKYRPDLPILMLTGSDATADAVRAIKEGASDFIVKPPLVEHLGIAIENAIRLSTLSHELAKLKRDKEGAVSFSDIIGYRTGFASTVAYGRKAAACDVPVLLLGETGTGKELVARAIHGESRRIGAPFLVLNCSAFAANIEQQLFGEDPVANTPRVPGKLRAAEGGTLFLDDITELSPDAQVRLLRVLQQKEIEPRNGGRPVKVNVRFVTATNRDIRREVEAGRFREDLYFRLSVLPIPIPPLREHPQDILPLAEHFIQRLALSDRLPVKTLAADAKSYLTHHRWLGNVRELEGLIHRALVLSEGEEIDRALLEEIHESGSTAEPQARQAPTALYLNLRHADGEFKTMQDIENEAMHTLLTHCNNNVANAADALRIAKSTFYRKMKAAL